MVENGNQVTDHKLANYGELAREFALLSERGIKLWQKRLDAAASIEDLQIPDPEVLTHLFGEFFTAVARDPEAFVRTQLGYWQSLNNLWFNQAQRMLGQSLPPLTEPDRVDRRFRDEAWQKQLVFDSIKQSYLLTVDWAEKLVSETNGLDDYARRCIQFYTRRYLEALAPTNFVVTNPQVMREAQSTNGESLLRGLRNLIQDLEQSDGQLQISTTKDKNFKLGENIATTPGKVIYQNELMQLIQYSPSTETVYEKPLLIIPPWINKFYILDLKPKNSFVKWSVDQGFTLFVISWINPDRDLAHKSFEDYMLEGPIEALQAIEQATGAKTCSVIGYCIGGTLTACLLSYLSARNVSPISAATFFTTMTDFSDPGDLGVFIDETQLSRLENHMREKGFLEAQYMQRVFSLMRANDLIWSFVVNNYLLGKDPTAFDLLYWNNDGTRMPAMMHSFYLRKLYQENLLTKPGGISLAGVPIDLHAIDVPCYFLSTREDHIAPWQSTFNGSRLFGSEVEFVLGGSGHIAGVINPPPSKKYGYWTSESDANSANIWFQDATHHEGSWWPHWARWLGSRSGQHVPARQPGDRNLAPIEDAPGSYVRARGMSV